MIDIFTDGSTINNCRLSKKARGGVGVHFPSDVIVGGIFGILTGLFFAYGINKINFS